MNVHVDGNEVFGNCIYVEQIITEIEQSLNYFVETSQWNRISDISGGQTIFFEALPVVYMSPALVAKYLLWDFSFVTVMLLLLVMVFWHTSGGGQTEV